MRNNKGKVVITGGSGFLGLNLAKWLVRLEYEVTVISRNRPKEEGKWRWVPWDGRNVGRWKDELDGARAIVNLAGKSVDCVKTPDNCDLILRSRVESTAVIGQALRAIKKTPPVWVQMSTAHIYGDSPSAICSEDYATGYGLAPFVGKAWEDAFYQAVLPEMRQVVLRTSFVLGKSGGALPTLAKLAKLGLGGTVASGQQGISWIHEVDMNRLFVSAIEDESMQGMYIASAPNPVSNQSFMKSLRKTLNRPIGLPATAWMVKLASALIFRTDPELVLYGRYVISSRLEQEGFRFEFPIIQTALDDLFEKEHTYHLRRAYGGEPKAVEKNNVSQISNRLPANR